METSSTPAVLATLLFASVLIGPLTIVLHIVLLARISHWTHAAQKKLDESNRVLMQIDQRLADNNRLTGHLVGRS